MTSQTWPPRQGKGTVINLGNPRDLEKLALEYSSNPSIWKKMLHSNFILPYRRAVQSKGAFASAVGKVAQKSVGLMLDKIPVPIVSDILVKSADKAANYIRERIHNNKIDDYFITPEDKVKYNLKELGKEVEKLDAYRWKIKHAVDEYNKVIGEAETMASQPCDRWVAVMVKLKYLKKRIDKLRASTEMIKAVCDETENWLKKVESDYDAAGKKIEPLMNDDIQKLKQFAGAHETCSEVFCMYKNKRYSESKLVPTSKASEFIIKSASIASDLVGNDPTEYYSSLK